MTVIYMVRHGPTHAKTMVGWTDCPADLSDAAALARLSEFLPDDAVMISSDLIRAVTTADALAAPARQRLPHDPRLRELHFGDWEDRTHSDISAEDPETSAAFWERPGPTAPPGGESFNMLTARVTEGLDALTAHPVVIIVAHFGAILSQVQRARGAGTENLFAQPIRPLSVTRLRFADGQLHEELVDHCP